MRAANELCRIYRPVVFRYLLGRGVKQQDADDLTQDLFERFTSRGSLAEATPDRGRLRHFLFESAKNLARESWRRQSAAKRGGGVTDLALDAGEPPPVASPTPSPDAEFDKAWALAVIDEVRTQLRMQAEADGKGEQFAALEPHLDGDANAPPYTETSAAIGKSENATRIAAHKLRKEFSRRLIAEVRETLRDPTDLRDEMTALRAALGGT